jgi:hypothetical protein
MTGTDEDMSGFKKDSTEARIYLMLKKAWYLVVVYLFWIEIIGNI